MESQGGRPEAVMNRLIARLFLPRKETPGQEPPNAAGGEWSRPDIGGKESERWELGILRIARKSFHRLGPAIDELVVDGCPYIGRQALAALR